MNSRFANALFVISLFLFVTSPVVAQSGFAVIDVSQQLTDDGLVITYKFNKSVASLAQSQLSYRKVTSNGSTERQVPFVTPTPNNMTFSFKIPESEFDGANRLEFQAKLVNGAGTTVFTSQQSTFDLGFFNDFREQVKTATDKATALDTQATDLKIQLTSSNDKLEAAQKSLNAITVGLEPQRVNFVQTNLVTDGRIVLTFNTGDVPGRIRATIDGPNGFNKPKDSDNISTQHVISFDGLLASTDCRRTQPTWLHPPGRVR
jgi:hypothetical protein